MPTFYDQFVAVISTGRRTVALEIQRHDQVESYTYAERRRMAESVGRWLTEKKLGAGARIAIFADNHPRWVAAYLGSIASGYAAVPLRHRLSRRSGHQSCSRTAVCSAGLRRENTWRSRSKAVTGLGIEIGAYGSDKSREGSGPARWIGDLDGMFAAGPGGFAPSKRPPTTWPHCSIPPAPRLTLKAWSLPRRIFLAR